MEGGIKTLGNTNLGTGRRMAEIGEAMSRRRVSIVAIARRWSEARDAFEIYAAKRDSSIGGSEWTRLWREAYALQKQLEEAVLLRFSRFSPPYFRPPMLDLDDRPKRRRKPRLRVMKGGRT